MVCILCLSSGPARSFSSLESCQELVTSTLGLTLAGLVTGPHRLCLQCKQIMQKFEEFRRLALDNIEFAINNQNTIQANGPEKSKLLLSEKVYANIEDIDAKEEDSDKDDLEDQYSENQGEMGDFEYTNDMEEDEIKSEPCTDKTPKIRKHRSGPRKPGFCEICQKNYACLSDHMSQVHYGSGDNPCTICGKVFKNKKCLYSHMARHNAPMVPCEECGKLIKSGDPMKKHMKYFHKVSDIPCTYPDCAKLFKQPQTLQIHKQTVHLGETTLCNCCGETVKNLNAHKPVCKERPENRALRTCSFCQRLCSSSTTRKLHENSIHGNEPPTTCNICGKTVKGIEKHIENIHSPVKISKPRICIVDGCRKSFKTNTELNAHTTAVHLKTKEQCPDCDQWFSVSHLKTHLRLVHGNGKKRVYEGKRQPCPECGRTFSKLREHMKSIHGIHSTALS